MLFDFMLYIEDLREHPEKKDLVEKYEKILGPLEGTIQDQLWYKEYIEKFPTIDYKVPEDLQDDFDWKILMQLVAGSFSSTGSFEFGEDKEEGADFVITVQSGTQTVIKTVSSLYGFQIAKLFDIYVEEQMNLQVMLAEQEDATQKEFIESQREYKFVRWQSILDMLQQKEVEQHEQHEKDEKLQNLYEQL